MELDSLQFAPAEIDQAGRILARGAHVEHPGDEWLQAARLVNDWRASHSQPLNTFQVNLRRRVGRRGVVARRLKRMPSIIAKLTRLTRIRLSRMQDIAGCRAIVGTSEDAFNLSSELAGSRIRHELMRRNDYITSPRSTGYRGLHLMYAYNSDRSTRWQGYNVEVQIRSRLQHQWATAVETVGTFTGQDLKSNRGNPAWLRFFALMSTVVARQEGMPEVPNTPTNFRQLVREIQECDQTLGVAERLAAFQTITHELQSIRGIRNHWVVLELNPDTDLITGRAFAANSLSDATSFYLERELANRGNPRVDVVMVSAGSLNALRRAYPNYFADLRDFRLLFQQTLAS